MTVVEGSGLRVCCIHSLLRTHRLQYGGERLCAAGVLTGVEHRSAYASLVRVAPRWGVPAASFMVRFNSFYVPSREAKLIVLCGILLPAMLVCAGAASAQVDRYRQALAATLPSQARAALSRIEDAPRRMLAMRSYLRVGPRLSSRWSWSDAQIAAFGTTREYRELMEEVDRVKTRFESANPGYTLYANTQVRSLDTQIERWNENRSVGEVAQEIQRAVREELLKSGYPARPTDTAVDRLATFLRQWRPPRAAALAAPGLSLHGQLRAIDFAVFKNGKLVAPTNMAAAEAVWERQGWSAKLKRATVGTRFVGPLRSPHEPWHYEYVLPENGMSVAAD